MSSEQEIKATVTIEGEVSMWRYYVPNADMDGTRKRLREAEFREIDEPRASLLKERFLLQGREGMSSEQVIKATVRIEKEVSMGREGEKIPMVEIDPMLYYLPGADKDGTRAKLREAEFVIEGHIRDCQGVGCGATCRCHCHAGELRG